MCVYSLLFILSNLHCLAKGVKFLLFQFFDLEIPILHSFCYMLSVHAHGLCVFSFNETNYNGN